MLDFGVVVLGTSRMLQFELINVGMSRLPWSAAVCDDPAHVANADDLQCFAVAPDSGLVDDFTLKTNAHAASVVVTFTPKRATQFHGRVRVASPLLPQPIFVTLRGESSFDQSFIAL